MNHLLRKISVAVINTALPEPYNSYGDHWIDGFEDAGCTVKVFKYSEIEYIPARFDLYFFVEIRYNPSVIPWYLGPRVLYSWDSHIMSLQEFDRPSKCFDKILLASKIDADTLQSQGVTNAFWIPEACNPRIHKNLHLPRTEKLGFIGNLNNTFRRNGFTKNDFIDHFKPYHKTHVWGNDYTAEQNKIRVMFDRPISHNIGTRVFESSAAGCVPLWSKAGFDNGIDELLYENFHYISYDDTIQGLEKVLEDLDEAKMDRIAKAAEKHVLNNHTYAHRARQVLDLCGVKAIPVTL